MQNDIAKYLQVGPRRLIVCGFRGVAKSYITVALVLWMLFLNPDIKILVVSANEGLAKDFVRLARKLIDGMPLLQHMKPEDLDNALAFDIRGANDSKNPSMKSAGITGQITGGRADVIIADDIEVPKNSYTHLLRERIAELVKEFDAVLTPGGRVIYLGTPQTEASVYMKLIQRGYEMRVWPIELPEKPEIYGGRLAPFIQRMLDRGLPAHTPTEPGRFPESEIAERKASYGIAGFALQFMLDTNPADSERNPLKTRDLIIDDVDAALGAVSLVWGSGPQQVIQDLQSGGFDGDLFVRPMYRSPDMVKFQGTVMAIDPSGKGGDETSYAIVRYLNGMLYLVASGGFKDGFGEGTLKSLARLMIVHRVNYWIAEENYGGGMFNQLLKPVIKSTAEDMKVSAEMLGAIGASLDEDYDGWSSTQKELRILDTLEPILKSHRLVVDRRVIDADLLQQNEQERFSLIYQLTRMARIRGCLPNEDRLDSLAMACNYWTQRMSRDNKKAEEQHKHNMIDAELKKFMKSALGANAVTKRGSQRLVRR